MAWGMTQVVKCLEFRTLVPPRGKKKKGWSKAYGIRRDIQDLKA
jgi:hypothetical protein